jgi:proteasome assembly chaperone (PAC2) family protein
MIELLRVFSFFNSPSRKEEVFATGTVMISGWSIGDVIGAIGRFITLDYLYDLEGIGLLGKASGYMMDSVSSIEVLDVMEQSTRIRSDWMELRDIAEQMMIEVVAIVNVVILKFPDDFGYIG